MVILLKDHPLHSHLQLTLHPQNQSLIRNLMGPFMAIRLKDRPLLLRLKLTLPARNHLLIRNLLFGRTEQRLHQMRAQ